MRVISLSHDGEYEIVHLCPDEFNSCVSTLIGGPYRMISADSDILLDCTLMICDREDYEVCRRNPVASTFNLSERTGRYIYGEAVLAKLGKTDNGYCICDFTDEEIITLNQRIDVAKELLGYHEKQES